MHGRRRAFVQEGDDPLRELRPHTYPAGSEPVGEAHHGRPHDVLRRSRALPNQVAQDDLVVEPFGVLPAKRDPLQHTNAGGEPVDGVALIERPLHYSTSGPHAVDGGGVECHLIASPRDGQHLLESEVRTGEDDRHGGHCTASGPPDRDAPLLS